MALGNMTLHGRNLVDVTDLFLGLKGAKFGDHEKHVLKCAASHSGMGHH